MHKYGNEQILKIRLFALFIERKMVPPIPKEFSWFYTLKSNKGDLGFFYLPSGRSGESRSLPRLKRVLVIGRTLSSLLLRSAIEVASALQVSFPRSFFLKHTNARPIDPVCLILRIFSFSCSS